MKQLGLVVALALLGCGLFGSGSGAQSAYDVPTMRALVVAEGRALVVADGVCADKGKALRIAATELPDERAAEKVRGLELALEHDRACTAATRRGVDALEGAERALDAETKGAEREIECASVVAVASLEQLAELAGDHVMPPLVTQVMTAGARFGSSSTCAGRPVREIPAVDLGGATDGGRD